MYSIWKIIVLSCFLGNIYAVFWWSGILKTCNNITDISYSITTFLHEIFSFSSAFVSKLKDVFLQLREDVFFLPEMFFKCHF